MINQRSIPYKEIRNQQYYYHYKNYPYLKNWRKNPYSFLKAIFYMECSAILVFFLLKTKIKPNTITLHYALSGIIGGVFLAIPFKTTIIIALFIFFVKGILDWSDGHFARITNQTSITGHVLDVYGAHMNEVGFYLGLGYYIAIYSSMPIFFYFVPIYTFLVSINVFTYSKRILFDEHKSKHNPLQPDKDISYKLDSSSIERNKFFQVIKQKVISFLSSFLDGRARTIDFICLVILFELYFPFKITWVILILLLFKHFFIFIGSFYLVVNKNWIEKIINDQRIKKSH